MSASNDGNDGDKDQRKPFRKVKTTNLLKNEGDNMSTLSDLLDVFLRISLGIDQQEVILMSGEQMETFGPFLREYLPALLPVDVAGNPAGGALETVAEVEENIPAEEESDENGSDEAEESGNHEKSCGA